MVTHFAEFYAAGEQEVATPAAIDRLQGDVIIFGGEDPVFGQGIGGFYATKPVSAGEGAVQVVTYRGHLGHVLPDHLGPVVEEKTLHQVLEFGKHGQAA